MSNNIDRSRAIVLLSGGLDSATVLSMAKAQGFEIIALSFRYGQRHAIELEAAKKIARSVGVLRHVIIELDLAAVGNSALTNKSIAVPKHSSTAEIGTEIPVTYVPARNTLFLSYALAWAESLNAWDIFVGVNALDYSGYPDCRPEFVAAFEQMANLATKAGVEAMEKTGSPAIKVHAPLILMTKSEIIARGLELGVDYASTSSCYDPFPDGTACGRCDSCLLRQAGFRQNGTTDPIAYTR